MLKWWNRWRTADKPERQSGPLIEELEPRVLLSADAAGVFAPNPGDLQQQTPTELLLDDDLEQAPAQSIAQEESRTLELVFVDTDTPDYQSIVDSLTEQTDDNRQFEVILLDNNRDGVWQVSQALQNYSDVNAIHLVSHGSEGSIDLGNTQLDAATLQVQQDQFLTWSDYLTSDADILIYGCNLAADETGLALMRGLAEVTGADVAASDNLTGHGSLGGDWVLEVRVGEVETGVFASQGLLENFRATLAAPTANDDNGGYTAAVNDLNPDGYFELDGTDITDSSGNNSGGADVSGGVSTVDDSPIAGSDADALDFDRSSSGYVQIPHSSNYEVDEGAISLWFKTSDINSGDHLFSKDASGTAEGGHLSIEFNGSGQLSVRLQHEGGGSTIATTGLTLDDDAWHNVVFTFGSNGMRLYVDGVEEASDAAYIFGLRGDQTDPNPANRDDPNQEPISLGASRRNAGSGMGNTPSNGFFEGAIDEFAIVDQQLSLAQIQSLYNSAATPASPDYIVEEGDTLRVSAADGVMANDDDGGEATTVAVLAGPSNASAFTLNADGSFEYTPNTGFTGTDTFTYTATNTDGSDTATVTITVDPSPPEFQTIETADIDGDGFVDALNITFDRAIDDSTVEIDDFTVAGATVTGITSGTADDNQTRIDLTDGVLSADATPTVSYAQDGATDIAGLASGITLEDTDSQAWWDQDWLNRVKISFDNSAASASVNDFPVLVQLTGNDVDFDLIKAGGEDIRFVDSDGTTELDFDIQSWDDVNETATIWVKVPEITATSTDFIHVYYNNDDASAYTNAGTVWEDFAGVWHLDDSATTYSDASSNGNDGTSVSGVTPSTGQVGGGQAFNGVDGSGDNLINAGNDNSLAFETQSVTLEAWVNIAEFPDSGGGGYLWYDVAGIEDRISLYLGDQNGSGDIYLNAEFNNDDISDSGNTPIQLQEWTHVAVTYDGTRAKGYINGQLDWDVASSEGNLDDNNNPFIIGDWATPADNPVNGIIDEVRYSSVVRDADWMSATYASLNGNFVSFGRQEATSADAVAPGAPVVTGITDDSTPAAVGVTNDNTLVISGTAEANSTVEVFIDGGSIGTTTADGSGDWSYDHTGVTLADGDYTLTATASDSSGNVSATSADFDITVNAINSTPTGSVTISGTAQVGSLLTASNTLADADGLGEISYQWFNNGSPISGATDSYYVVAAGDLGDNITVEASYTDDFANAESVSSSPVVPTAANPGPYITAVTTSDSTNSGFIDQIQLTFSESIDDGTLTADDFTVAGGTVTGITSGTADDNAITLDITDGDLDTGATPIVTYLRDAPADADLANPSGALAGDYVSWWDTNWQNRVRIDFDNSNSAENLTGFPVLLHLTAAELDFSAIQSGGADIRFVDGDGTELDYQIESWTDGVETSVWVRLPQLDAGSNDDFIHMYYGNGSASDDQNPPGVWPAGIGVYHLGEDPSGGAGAILDSDGSANNGTPGGSMDASDLVAGQIGDALDFDGNNDRISFGAVDVGDTFTISAWVRPDSTAGTGIRTILANSGQGASQDGFRLFINESGTQNGRILFETGNGSSGRSASTPINTINFDEWNHIAVEVDRAGGTATIYVNGVDVTDPTDTAIRTDFETNSTWDLGQMQSASLEFMGAIDEVRIENTARSAEWVEASYLSQNYNSAFINIGAEESVTVDAAAPVASITRDDSNPSNAGSVAFSVDFSEDVANLVAGDFNVVTTGTAAFTTVNFSTTDASTYTVTVSGITGDGTLGLEFNGGIADVADAAGVAMSATPAVSESYNIDNTVAAPTFALASDTGASAIDGLTNDATVNVTLAADVASWEYSLDSGGSFTAGTGTSFELADNTTYAIGSIQVRQTDNAGNVSSVTSNAAAIVTDMSVVAPSFVLAADTGASAIDGITNDATVNVTLVGDVDSWEYSTDNGATFTAGTGTSFELADNTTYAIGSIQVRQTDNAGNLSASGSNVAAIRTDTSVVAPTFALATDSGASAIDGLTNDATVNVTLAGDVDSWEYSTDNGATFTAGTGTSFELADNTIYAIGSIQVRQTDTAGNLSATSSNTAAIQTDMSVTAPSFALAADTGASAVDGITNDATVNVTLVGDVDSWEYSTDNGATFTAGTGTSFELADNTTYAIGSIQVRQTDTAGNLSATSSNTAAIQTDMSVTAPSFALATDTGTSAVDGVTNDATVNVTLVGDVDSWEYSTDNGATFTAGTGTSFELADNTTYAIGSIQVRQTDTAGNLSATSSNTAVIETDMAAPGAPSFALAADTGASAVDGITNDATVNVTLAGDAAGWEYSLDGGATYSAGAGTSFELADNTTYAIGDIVVRQTDTAGNLSATSSNVAAIQTDISVTAPTFALASDTGASAVDGITNDATVNVTLVGDVESWEYSTDGGATYTTGTGTSFELADNTTYAIGDIVVRQTDTAGNLSATSSNVAAIQTDTSVVAPSFALATDTGISAVDGITSDATVNLTLVGDVDSWEYSTDGGATYTTGTGTSFELADNTTYAISDIVVRQTDTAGNLSATSSNTATIETDMTAPGLPSFALAADTGASAVDGITNDATVNVTLAGDAAGWEYSLDAGSTFSAGTGTSFELADNTTYAIGDIVVRQSDSAGNVSATASNIAAIQTDMSVVAPSFALATDTGTSAVDGVTSDATVNVTLVGDVDSWEYSTDGGATYTAGTGTSFELADNTTYAIGDVVVRQTDTAGNLSATSSNTAAIQTDMAAPAAPAVTIVNTDTGAADLVTADTNLAFGGTAEANSSVEVFLNGSSIGTTTADASGDWSFDYTTTTLTDGGYTLTAQATDTAGNVGVLSGGLAFTIDTSIPVATVSSFSIDTGDADGITSDNGLVFTGTASAGSRVEVFLNGTSIGTTTATGGGAWSFDHSATPLADGAYALTAQATDLSTGQASAIAGGVSFTVDTVGPSSAVLAISQDTGAADNVTADNTLFFIGSAEADSSVRVFLDSGSGPVSVGTIVADSGGSWRIDYRSTALADGTYTLTSVATDGTTGQSGPVSSGLTFTIDTSNQAPAGTVTISNSTPSEGDTLTASNTLSDPDGIGSVTYHWQIDTGSGFTDTGVTGDTYTTSQSDVGATLRVEARYTDLGGFDESVASAGTAAVSNVDDAGTGGVTIDNLAPAAGDVLTAANDLDDPDGISGTIAYQWQRDGVDIPGQNGTIYITSIADVGAVISVTASYVDDFGGTGNASSVATAPVAAAGNEAPGGSLEIAGSTIEDQTLSATNLITDADGMGTISYQWQRDGADVSGATGETYTLGQEDVGSSISVVASYVDGGGTTETVSSGATAAIENLNDAPVGDLIAPDSDTAPGTVLTADGAISDEDGIGTPIRYQWLRDSVPIDGATSNTYELTDADIGSVVTVSASYTDSFGTEETVVDEGITVTASSGGPTDPTEPPVEDPAEDPAVDPFEAPADEPTQDSVETPAEQPNPIDPPEEDAPTGGGSTVDEQNQDNPTFVPQPDTGVDTGLDTVDPGQPVLDLGDDLDIGQRAGSSTPINLNNTGGEDTSANEAASESETILEEAQLQGEEVLEDLLSLIQDDDNEDEVDLAGATVGSALEEVEELLEEEAAEDEIMAAVLTNHAMWDAIDRMHEQMEQTNKTTLTREELVVQLVSTSSVGIFAALTIYALRGGALMASWLSTMPLWGTLDPLPVLSSKKTEAELEEEEKGKGKKRKTRDAESLFGSQGAES